MSAKLTVAQFMTRSPYTIGADQPLSLAHRMMRTNNLRHLPVLAEGQLVGLVSERDLAVIEASRRLDADKATVDKAMTAEPYAVAPGAALVDVVREMAAQRHGSAVVVDGGNVVGIFTTVDALLALAHVLDGGVRQRARHAAG
jgi:acetoin utilization protein AcuB